MKNRSVAIATVVRINCLARETFALKFAALVEVDKEILYLVHGHDIVNGRVCQE